MTDFKELREALDAGPTDGPWEAKRWTSEEGGCYGWSLSAGGYLLPLSDMETDSPDECDANAAFIAAANPATIRSLLAELDEARRDAERATKLPNRMPIPHQSACDIEYSSGFDMGYAQGWNDAIDAMKEQQP